MLSEVKWSEVKWSEVKWSEVKWSEVKWSEVKIFGVMCVIMDLYLRSLYSMSYRCLIVALLFALCLLLFVMF
jgi:hypothetical protein